MSGKLSLQEIKPNCREFLEELIDISSIDEKVADSVTRSATNGYKSCGNNHDKVQSYVELIQNKNIANNKLQYAISEQEVDQSYVDFGFDLLFPALGVTVGIGLVACAVNLENKEFMYLPDETDEYY